MTKNVYFRIDRLSLEGFNLTVRERRELAERIGEELSKMVADLESIQPNARRVCRSRYHISEHTAESIAKMVAKSVNGGICHE